MRANKSTTKTRIVFDASGKFQGKSLNSKALPGARFSKAPETFRARKAARKTFRARKAIAELFYSHILNMNRGSLHARSFRRIHLSVS